MTKKMRCVCCSTSKEPVYVIPVKDGEGYMNCPECGSIELEAE